MVKIHITQTARRLNLIWNQHPVRMINMVLLIGCLVAGWLLYAGKFYGAHEDLAHLSPLTSSNEWEYFVRESNITFHLHFAMWILPWRLFVRIFQLTPETFPWWFPIALNLFYISASPVNFSASLQNLIPNSKRMFWPIGLLLLGTWTITPVAFGTTLFIPVAFTSNYAKTLFVLSCATYLWSKPLLNNRWEKLLLIVLYIDLALYPVSLPVVFALFAGTSLLKILSLPDLVGVLLKQIFVGTTITCAVLILMFKVSDLYMQSQHVYNVAIPDASSLLRNLYQPIPFGYATLPPLTADDGNVRPWHKTDWPFLFAVKSTYSSDRSFVLIHIGLLVALLCSLSTLSFAYVRRFGLRNGASLPHVRRLLTTLLISLIYAGAFHASTAFYFFTPHFPQYIKALPALLVTISWSCFIWCIVQISNTQVRQQIKMLWMSDPLTFSSDRVPSTTDERATFLLSVCAIAFILVYITLPNFGRVIDTYRYEVYLGEQRLNIRQNIINLHINTGKNNFLLLGCPTLFETSWAFDTYFQWRGYPSIQVVMEDAPNYGPAIKADPNWVQLPCTDRKFVSP